jgi:hypothetical protein
LTADGALPVEFLSPGDRIITRAGLRVLRCLTVHPGGGPLMRICASSLGHDRPARDMLLPAETSVLVRDWRARALFGRDHALVPVAQLSDDEFIHPTRARDLPVFTLTFDQPQVVYADGAEIGCGGVPEVAHAA